ncbi:unnamed protein product [Lactuca saligna]|uniref:Uncharacterized protein n=1 Tax=Lactuca saligna TaxID=75948 RepID=A0AA36EK12_LACSI|nr:unnamed protein product [Lactuca saligna]
MTKEIAKIDQNYSNIHTKVNIFVDAFKNIVELYTSLIIKVDFKSESNYKHFVKLEELLGNVKGLVSKLNVSPSYSVSQELLSKMYSSLESNLRFDLAPLMKFVNLMPTDATPVLIGVQGGEKGVGASKDSDQGKVVGKVISPQIPTSFPSSTSTISTTMTSKPLNKGVVIGSSIRGSSLKPPTSKEEMEGKGKGIKTDPTKEEKKIAFEKETEKQRHIQSILR